MGRRLYDYLVAPPTLDTFRRLWVGLSFLPVEEVSHAFFELRREFPAETNLFLDYFEKNFF